MIKIFIDKERPDYKGIGIQEWLEQNAVMPNGMNLWYCKYVDQECAVLVFENNETATAFKLTFSV